MNRGCQARRQCGESHTRPYEIAKTEVTQAQWEELGFPNPAPIPHCPDCPVYRVNWYEAAAYCSTGA
ncbi:MAG: hypothetical protein MUC50_22900 [Myxococcota bacterium]|nr:hypothetical protein [Myxococcota bacterium]